jgi:hypothetical protein
MDNKIYNNKIFIYYHVCLINNWEEVTNKIFQEINKSGLIDIIENLFIFILGDITKDNCQKIKKITQMNPKYIIKKFSKEIQLYERFTLNSLLDDCKNKYVNCKILYLHSKGITRPNYPNVEDWVNYLIYFNVKQHRECINLLDKYDTCSVNLVDKPAIHYSGNFWWANSEYIKIINPLRILNNQNFSRAEYIKYYLEPEMWICSKIKKAISLHNSNLNHYNEKYKLDSYENKINYFCIEA